MIALPGDSYPEVLQSCTSDPLLQRKDHQAAQDALGSRHFRKGATRTDRPRVARSSIRLRDWHECRSDSFHYTSAHSHLPATGIDKRTRVVMVTPWCRHSSAHEASGYTSCSVKFPQKAASPSCALPCATKLIARNQPWNRRKREPGLVL